MTFGRGLRHTVNAVSGITLFGLLLGWLSLAKPSLDRQRGLIVFSRSRLRWPWAGAVTFGDVVLLLSPRWHSPADVPAELLDHEARHARQYVFLLGLPYFPLYWLACAASWALTGDHYSANPFERGAGLAAGGYLAKPLRWRRFHP